MADRLISADYRKMIMSLYQFSSQTMHLLRELHSDLDACMKGVGTEDSRIGRLRSYFNDVEQEYMSVALKAADIAEKMEEELRRAEQDGSI